MLNVGQQLGICFLSHCYPPPKGYAAILNRNFNLRECIEIARRTVESLSKLHELDIAQKDLSLADIYIRPSKVSITRISNHHIYGIQMSSVGFHERTKTALLS